MEKNIIKLEHGYETNKQTNKLKNQVCVQINLDKGQKTYLYILAFHPDKDDFFIRHEQIHLDKSGQI